MSILDRRRDPRAEQARRRAGGAPRASEARERRELAPREVIDRRERALPNVGPSVGPNLAPGGQAAQRTAAQGARATRTDGTPVRTGWRRALRVVRGTFAAGVLGGIVWGGVYSWGALDHPISRVRIDGPVDPAERAQVEAVVNRSLEGGVLSADVHAIAVGLRALGWTRSVSVRRMWPDGIEVSLAHSVPIARWNGSRLLGDDGRAYPFVGQRIDGDLPSLSGPAGKAPEVVRHYRVLREIVAPAGLLVTRTSLDEKGNWTMVLDDQIEVQLGNRDVLDRARRVVDLYTRHLAAERERVARVDARYGNGVAVAWRQPAIAVVPTEQRTQWAAANVAVAAAVKAGAQ